jgi:hypothetical protein
MMERLFHLLASIHNRLFGSKRLLPHEKLCLDSWRDSLTNHAKNVLDAQLASLQFVQRQAAGAKVCFYFWKSKTPPLFDQAAPDLKVATVVLETSNGEQMPAKIYVHRGRFFSIEFPKRPDRFLEQYGMTGLLLKLAEVNVHVDL